MTRQNCHGMPIRPGVVIGVYSECRTTGETIPKKALLLLVAMASNLIASASTVRSF